jgi:hypothetical protein
MTYGLYAREWHLTNTVTAGNFAIDPLADAVMLVGFGGISDQIGHRATMLAGLFASLVGALLFAVAPNVCWVFAGRALMGIGVGLVASPSTAAILQFTSRNKSAASVTMGAEVMGFTAALLISWIARSESDISAAFRCSPRCRRRAGHLASDARNGFDQLDPFKAGGGILLDHHPVFADARHRARRRDGRFNRAWLRRRRAFSPPGSRSLSGPMGGPTSRARCCSGLLSCSPGRSAPQWAISSTSRSTMAAWRLADTLHRPHWLRRWFF